MYQLKKTPSSAKSCNFHPPFSDVEKTVALFGKIKGIFPFVQFLAFAKRQEDPTWDHDVILLKFRLPASFNGYVRDEYKDVRVLDFLRTHLMPSEPLRIDSALLDLNGCGASRIIFDGQEVYPVVLDGKEKSDVFSVLEDFLRNKKLARIERVKVFHRLALLSFMKNKITYFGLSHNRILDSAYLENWGWHCQTFTRRNIRFFWRS